MILRIYKVNKELPEYIIHDSLECNNIWDIDTGTYKKVNSIEVNYYKVKDLIYALENEKIENIDFEKSNIIEIIPDEKMLNENSIEKLDCNFLILTGLGWQEINIDKESIFRDLSLRELHEMFMFKVVE